MLSQLSHFRIIFTGRKVAMQSRKIFDEKTKTLAFPKTSTFTLNFDKKHSCARLKTTENLDCIVNRIINKIIFMDNQILTLKPLNGMFIIPIKDNYFQYSIMKVNANDNFLMNNAILS